MIYVLIERQATTQTKVGNKTYLNPSFMTSELSKGEESIPCFLSRLQAALYLHIHDKRREFKVVSINDISLGFYRSACEQQPEAMREALPQCRVAFKTDRIAKYKGVPYSYFSRKSFSVVDMLCHTNNVEEDLKLELGEKDYVSALGEDDLSDEKILELVLSKKNKVSIVEKVKDFFEKKKAITPADKGSLGAMYAFVLQDDGQFVMRGNTLIAFVNKLDAVIFSLIRNKVEGKDFQVVPLDVDDPMFRIMAAQQKQGLVQMQLVFGFLGVSNSFGVSWAKFADESSEKLQIASMFAVQCQPADFEGDFDLEQYFYYVTDKEELERALDALVNTNTASVESLLPQARSFLEDMKNNIKTVGRDTPGVAHRILLTS